MAAASVLPLGLADKLVMAVEVPELLPMDGHLIGNPNRTATGSYHLRPFGRPPIEGFFGGRLALEAAGKARFSISPLLSLSIYSAATFAPACAPSLEPAGGAILLRGDPIVTHFLAMQMRVPHSPRLWMEDSFLPERRARDTTSRRRMALF